MFPTLPELVAVLLSSKGILGTPAVACFWGSTARPRDLEANTWNSNPPDCKQDSAEDLASCGQVSLQSIAPSSSARVERHLAGWQQRGSQRSLKNFKWPLAALGLFWF